MGWFKEEYWLPIAAAPHDDTLIIGGVDYGDGTTDVCLCMRSAHDGQHVIVPGAKVFKPTHFMLAPPPPRRS